MKNIDWYYVCAMVLMVITCIYGGYSESVFVGMGWILARKAINPESKK